MPDASRTGTNNVTVNNTNQQSGTQTSNNPTTTLPIGC
jgi:hypothetical protein